MVDGELQEKDFFMTNRYFILLAVAVTLLSGCAVTPKTDPYAAIDRLDATPFNNPEIPLTVHDEKTMITGALNLEQAIRIALTNNPEIAATQWDVSAASSKMDIARATRWPSLSIEGGYVHTIPDQRLIAATYNREPGIFDSNFYRGDLVVKMPLFTAGRIINEIDAAKLLRDSEEKRLARTRNELIFNVSSTFYSMLGQREILRSLEFSVKTMEEHHKRVSELLAVEKAANVDLLRTEVRLADLRQDLLQERNVFAVEKRVLTNLLGTKNDKDSFSIKGTLTFEELADLSTKDLTLTAMKKRSDYLSAKDRLAAQARKVDAARAGHWPTVSLFGAYGARLAGSGDSEDLGNLGVGVSVPIFEGGRVTAQVNQERAALAAAKQRLRKIELQIRQEVEVAVLDIQSSSQRIHAVQQSINQAQESLRIERMKYDLASGSMTDVLDTQSALLQSETNYARALADYRIAKERLKLATGENAL